MGKLRNTVLVLGEGPTEFYYFNSLRDVYKGMAIKPDYPEHTSCTTSVTPLVLTPNRTLCSET